MEPIIKFDLKSIFETDPTFLQFIVSIGIVVVIFLIWFIVQQIVKKLIRFSSEKETWVFNNILLISSRKLFGMVFLLIGIYSVFYYLPFSIKLSKVVFSFSKVSMIIIGTVYLARVGSKLLRHYQDKNSEQERTSSLFEIIAKILIYIIGGLIVLQSMGISITPLLTALGVGGLAVALALQETLSNLFAGIQIIAAKNMQPGDYIQLESGDEGYIVDIAWRSTTIRALPNRIIIIPNSKLSTSTVKNFSTPDPEIAVLIDVGVSYGSDLKKVEKVTIQAAKDIMQNIEGGVPEFEPFIRYHTFDAYSINFTVILRARTYVDQYMIKHEFVKLLHERYHSESIEIPFPITTVMMNNKKSE